MPQADTNWNINKEYKTPYPDVSKTFVAEQAGKTQTGRLNDIQQPKPKYEPELRYGQPAQVGQYANGPWGNIKSKKKVHHKHDAAYQAGKLWARVRVSAANVWIMSWAAFWYLSFQLPIAVISAAGIGMAAAVYSYAQNIAEGSFVGSWVVSGFEQLAEISYGSFADALAAIMYILFRIEVDPLSLFILPFLLVFLFGLFQLILTWFIYSLVGAKSLSGEHGGLKGLMFVLAGVGYAIPILNLFPLIFLWMITVWKYPK